MNKNVFFKPTDIIILAFILILCGLFYYFITYNKGEKALVIYDSTVIKELSLNEDITFSPEQNKNVVIQVKSGEVAFIHSDCPDKVCVNAGFLSRNGQSAACLPNKLMIVVKSAKDSAVDVSAY